ncbi:rCG47869 [Rattus norvegicus]|uniref:RCG47869 n=1 Tax=Rattus norvegicus TaxID=10116 RepID=A6I176_RAT|nr:rCG47869 [Rattus norvegicus]
MTGCLGSEWDWAKSKGGLPWWLLQQEDPKTLILSHQLSRKSSPKASTRSVN